MTNSQRKISRVFWFLTLLAAGLIFLPSAIGMDGMKDGFALAFLGTFLTIIFIVTAIVFGARARAWDRILAGEHLLARWRYAREEWRAWTEQELEEDRADKKVLFWIVAGLKKGYSFPSTHTLDLP